MSAICEIYNGHYLACNGRFITGCCMGDLVLLDAGLPHCWKTENKKIAGISSSVAVQFEKDFLRECFFEKPEMRRVAQLLQKSGSGVRFTNNIALYQSKMEELLHEQNSCKKVILLLDILHQLSLSKKYELLEKQRSYAVLSPGEQQRLHTVMAYIVEHFKDTVSLSTASSLANMTPQAFCKYFKRVTRKTFIEAATDYRVDYADQQLVHSSLSISQISFDSGFNDLFHFHKTFRSRMQSSQLCYRNSFLEKL